MNFKTDMELFLFLNNLKEIGFGSQGICYYNPKDKNVYKIFHQFFDNENEPDFIVNYTERDILKFSKILNNTFIWPNDIITVDNEIVGYKSKYISGKSLYRINPLFIDLDNLSKSISWAKKDIDIISDNRVVTYDMMYNILYNKNFYIIDHDDYTFLKPDMDLENNKKTNQNNFDMELYYFLVDGFFDDFVNKSKDLKELYQSKDIDVLVFLKLLRKYLSEIVGKKIVFLNDAKKCINKSVRVKKYQRQL